MKLKVQTIPAGSAVIEVAPLGLPPEVLAFLAGHLDFDGTHRRVRTKGGVLSVDAPTEAGLVKSVLAEIAA